MCEFVSARGPPSPISRRFDGVSLNVHAELLANHAGDGSKIVHRRIAVFRQHPVQTLGRFGCFGGKRFESHGCVHEITQDNARRVRLAIEEQRGRLVEQRSRDVGIAPSGPY